MEQAQRVHVEARGTSLMGGAFEAAETSRGDFIAHGTLGFLLINSALHK